jgi:hypothetical protein
MDGEAFQEWIQRVVRPYVELHNNSLYLLLDQFSVHMQHNNTFQLQQIGIEVDYIPAGYTPVLQVLDKGVHKPFKQYLREESIAFTVNHPEGTKPTGRLRSTYLPATSTFYVLRIKPTAYSSMLPSTAYPSSTSCSMHALWRRMHV